MRVVYQIIFTKGGIVCTRKFDGVDFKLASDFCNKVGGTMRIKRERMHVDWHSVL